MHYLKPGAIEHECYQGFYRYLDTIFYVRRDGAILNSISGTLCVARGDAKGYRMVHNSVAKSSVQVHRMLAELFVLKKKVYHNIVNHLDGDKTNNDVDNLEWTDYSGNIVHAFENNLRDDCKKIITKDIVTGEVNEYLGLNALARYLNVNPSKISIYMSSARKAPFENKLAIIWGGENWPNFTADDVYAHRNGLPKTVIGIFSDGRRLLFSSVGVAANYLGVQGYNIHAHLNSKKRLFPGNGYFLKYAYEYTKEPLNEFEMIDVKRERKISNFVRKPRHVLVTDTLTNETKEWESLELFGNSIGVKRPAIQKAVYLKGGYGKYKIEYIV